MPSQVRILLPPQEIVRRNNRDRRFFEILESLDENPEKNAGVAQLVERQPSKLNVAGSNPVSRSKISSFGGNFSKSIIFDFYLNQT